MVEHFLKLFHILKVATLFKKYAESRVGYDGKPLVHKVNITSVDVDKGEVKTEIFLVGSIRTVTIGGVIELDKGD